MTEPRRTTLLIVAGLLLSLATLPALAKQKILKPEQAFRYTVVNSGEAIIVDWTIEPDHYLYKERMSFATQTPGIELGEAQLPPGKAYKDEFFGDMHIYRSEARVRIPVIKQPADGGTLDLSIRSQGCADIGLCYPPQTWSASVELAAIAPSTKMSRMLASGNQRTKPGEPLPPEQAFQPLVTVTDPFTLHIDFNIAPGYYLYRNNLTVAVADNAPDSLAATGTPQLPPGTMQYDEHFGETPVFFTALTFDVPLTRSSPDPATLPIAITYQGCKKDSICYPPQMIVLDIDLPAATSTDQPRKLSDKPGPVSEQGRLSKLIIDGNIFIVLATFAGFGLLLAFTPCVLPMVPILSGIIAGQGKDVTTSRAFTLSLTYVLGMALTYTLAGAAFAAMGGQIQAALQKPWIIIGVAALFVALALSVFGLYELQMPAAIQTRISAYSNRQRAGTYVGTAIMGILSALVITTCVAPPLVATLSVIAQAGDVTRGALSLLAMSLGMGFPLLIIGTSAGRLLPKAGAWMDNIKSAFGFMMLGLAVWMLDRILPGVVTMLLWAALVLMAGVFLGAFTRLDPAAGTSRKLAKGAGLLAAVYGIALFIGALSGQVNPLRPLSFVGNQNQAVAIPFKRIKSIADLERELASATEQARPVMLDFYADWCVSCKEMEHYTFVDERVKANLRNTLLLQADVTANDAEDQALLKYFKIFGPPTIMFFDTQGKERTEYRVVGFMPADEFSRHVSLATGD
ncbi:MAG: protein-disulfide reductase DsbD [Gammaproteobacteria bacterium]|jgi:thiol:disulfide interchange protein DsbD|nr:protein-disulfide reductase DsbD [Gammaproteobacteria bacterium]